MKCLLRLKESPHYRRDAFDRGLRALGYEVVYAPPSSIGPDDLLICWNRYDDSDNWGKRYKAAGATTLVAENGYFGNTWMGDNWFALSRDQHNGAGSWPKDDGKRWASFGAEIAPYQPVDPRKDILALPQRSIGPRGVAMPRTWVSDLAKYRIPRMRVRPHPGAIEQVPLAEDLARARCVITWGSGAALKALLAGIPCISTWPSWIGASACTPIADVKNWDLIPQPARLPMFERLAGALWRVSEIESGEALSTLIQCKSA